MSYFRRTVIQIVFLTIIFTLAPACSVTRKDIGSSSGVQIDTKPETVIVYAYIAYPGVPEPTKTPNDKFCEYLPTLIVWGDGLTFLDENIMNEYNSVFSGKLDSTTLQKVFDILNSEHFFTGWKVPAPNPSGTSLKIGAKLKDRPVTEYISGDLEPLVYVQLIKTIKPKLKPLPEQNVVDKRVGDVLKANENCNKYMHLGGPAIPISTITSPSPVSTISGTALSWNQVVFYDSDPAYYDAKVGEDVTRISVLRSQQEVDQESRWIAPRNIQQVRSIDFSTFVAIIIYAGLEGENRYTIKIDALTKKDDSIFIYSTIAGAPNGEIRNPVVTSPYLVITLNKSDVLSPTKFTLIADCYSYSIKYAQKTIEITH